MRRHLLAAGLLLILALTWSSLVAAGQIEPAQVPISTAGTGALPVTPTPTIDRLAAPPTVYPPTQADDGAQLFWLYCQPCHGDQGQGLTDEWRAQYPEDHQNCWTSGCHGQSPYPEGFILPTSVPAVIGEGSLFHFATAGQLYHYVRAEMPYEYPGSLADEEYLAISAFLARAHGADVGQGLTAENIEQIRLRPTPVVNDVETGGQERWLAGGGLLMLLLVGGGWLLLRRQ